MAWISRNFGTLWRRNFGFVIRWLKSVVCHTSSTYLPLHWQNQDGCRYQLILLVINFVIYDKVQPLCKDGLPVVQLGCVFKFLKAWYFRLLFDPMKMFSFLCVFSQFIFKNSINSYLALFSLKSSLFSSSSISYNGIQNLEFWACTSAQMYQWICYRMICIFDISEMTAIIFILLKF